MSRRLKLQALTTLILAAAIGCPAEAKPSLKLSWQQIREVPNNIVLRLQNSNSTAVCVPDVEAKESLSFTQFGKRVEPFYYHNRAIRQWRGADLISGMIVVPPGRRIDIFFDLNEWRLRRGKATASVSIPAYDCMEFFAKSSLRAARLISRFTVDAPLSTEPKN
jgi:hypothetical protein